MTTPPRPVPEPGFPPSGIIATEWDRDSGPYDLLTGAGVLGARVWLERRLHRVVGTWARDAAGSAEAVVFDEVAMHHAWRAEVLSDRLPNLRELPTGRLVGPAPGDDISIDGLSGLTDDVLRAAAWTSLATALRDAHRDHLARTTDVADAPLRRWLPLVIGSLSADLDRVGRLGST